MNLTTVPERLKTLRHLMSENKIDAVVIPTGDYHLSEYCAPFFSSRAYVTGFTGSAGTAVITADDAGLWADSRYYLQAAQQLEGSGITLYRMQEPGVISIPDYLIRHLGAAAAKPAGEGSKTAAAANETASPRTVAFDGRVVSCFTCDMWEKKLSPRGILLKEDSDLVGEMWPDRPALPCSPVYDYPVRYAGKSRACKLAEVREQMAEKQADSLFISSLSDIAWLLNLRGNDVPCNPVFLSYLLVGKERARLFIQPEALTPELCEILEKDGIYTEPYGEAEAALRALPADSRLWLPVDNTSCGLRGCVPKSVTRITVQSPTVMMKAVKNPVEQENARLAHIRDGVAVVKWLYWLKKEMLRMRAGEDGAESPESVNGEKEFPVITEISAAARLEALRAEQEHAMGSSFEPIIGYGPHAAIVHYSATEESDVPLKPEGLVLADTGGQYLEGTTDITRTIALGPVTDEEKAVFTAVLRGHIAIARTVFKKGLSGAGLDALAHAPLWEMGKDYGHGTGHGVGHFLNVHEGPNAFRWQNVSGRNAVPPFEAGMITSDEPGFYEEGKFGVRHESLLLCVPAGETQWGTFLKFEELTQVPFDLDAVDPAALSETEKAWLNAYHAGVREKIAPHLTDEEREWLRDATRAI